MTLDPFSPAGAERIGAGRGLYRKSTMDRDQLEIIADKLPGDWRVCSRWMIRRADGLELKFTKSRANRLRIHAGDETGPEIMIPGCAKAYRICQYIAYWLLGPAGKWMDDQKGKGAA